MSILPIDRSGAELALHRPPDDAYLCDHSSVNPFQLAIEEAQRRGAGPDPRPEPKPKSMPDASA